LELNIVLINKINQRHLKFIIPASAKEKSFLLFFLWENVPWIFKNVQKLISHSGPRAGAKLLFLLSHKTHYNQIKNYSTHVQSSQSFIASISHRWNANIYLFFDFIGILLIKRYVWGIKVIYRVPEVILVPKMY